MAQLLQQLTRVFDERIKDLSDFLNDLEGNVGSSRSGLREAIQIAKLYPEARQERTQRDLERALEIDRLDLIRLSLNDVHDVWAFVEDWFAKGYAEISTALLRAVEDEASILLGQECRALLTIGYADNFETLVDDLRQVLFSSIQTTQAPATTQADDSHQFVIMRVPRAEGTQALYRPIILGHEVAHLAVERNHVAEIFDIGKRLDRQRLQEIEAPSGDPLQAAPPASVAAIGVRWIEELVCDAYAIRRFGPSALTAIATFLESVGATAKADEHPPGWFRVRCMLHWLSEGPKTLDPLLVAWTELTADEGRPPLPKWADLLIDTIEPCVDEIEELISDWPMQYDVTSRAKRIIETAERIGVDGIPECECEEDNVDEYSVLDADILNAGWLALLNQQPTNEVPIGALVAKSLESSEFLRTWIKHGGTFGGLADGQTPTDAVAAITASENVLPGHELRRILTEQGAQPILTPRRTLMMDGIGVDVRLGTKFIVFVRSASQSLDPLDQIQDPRSIQSRLDRDWGESFVLHPGELVLASTLEYLAMPANLSAQVITRSSYGRLGLLTATAVLVHPHFHGCLTLELVNLGVMPITLTPGQRVAQLTFQRVSPPADPPAVPSKYGYATVPQFSRVHSDEDAIILRAMRK